MAGHRRSRGHDGHNHGPGWCSRRATRGARRSCLRRLRTQSATRDYSPVPTALRSASSDEAGRRANTIASGSSVWGKPLLSKSMWRRERDSNPRGLAAPAVSRPLGTKFTAGDRDLSSPAPRTCRPVWVPRLSVWYGPGRVHSGVQANEKLSLPIPPTISILSISRASADPTYPHGGHRLIRGTPGTPVLRLYKESGFQGRILNPKNALNTTFAHNVSAA